jgi:hypothetical protein
MALYKNSSLVTQTNADAFDGLHSPSTPTPFSGIYRCEVCGHEIVSTYSHPLPPQNHAQHPQHRPIQWRLVVFAQHNK